MIFMLEVIIMSRVWGFFLVNFFFSVLLGVLPKLFLSFSIISIFNYVNSETEFLCVL